MGEDIKKESPDVILPMHQLSRHVAFDHLAHKQVECAQCHHKVKSNVESFTPYKCSSCHSTKKEDKSESNSYYSIVHGKNKLKNDAAVRCISCHNDSQKKYNKSDKNLTGCANSSCHK
ncbi:Class III cytochrome C family protein [Ferrimonas sediminum]|uniref:Class III cytochrome C family protein n=2 Tax=Ferrimonas sediminum TaxID=718193 RepID=A0A1G8TYB7_9GAMM|nr:Class III cytochrome C family protein [Ferrimonas sediminum]